jgi:hypothetical protein
MFDPLIPLRTDADLLEMARESVGSAVRRQTWLFLLDDDPEDIARFADTVSTVVRSVPGADAAVLVWERPGSPEVRMQEADWIAGLAASGAPIRLQLLASDEGVHVVDPDFAALVAR